MEKIENLKCFTFIPMLTEDDHSRDGKLIIYDGKGKTWEVLKNYNHINKYICKALR